jgi:hypothetical protein
LAKLVATFSGRGCRAVSETDLQGRIFCFLDREVASICFPGNTKADVEYFELPLAVGDSHALRIRCLTVT